ncbi:MAG: redoxin domain-containing protein, partial [Actinobacteria bacterium]
MLATVFGMAAVAKLGDRAGTGQAALEFGAPAPLAAPLALFIPVAELAVAGLLLPATTALAGAAGAAGLLVIFSAAIGVNLARGRTPECHCFGQLHSAPAGWQTLVRNAALFGVAAATVAGGIARHELSAVAWIGRLEGAELLALVAGAAAVLLLGLGGAAFFSVLRSYGRVLIRLDRIEQRLAEAGINVDEAELPPELGLEPGTPAPVFTTSDAAVKTVSLEDLVRPALPVLLVFTSPHCGPCKALLPAAARWQREHAPELTVAFASEGTYEAVRAEAE